VVPSQRSREGWIRLHQTLIPLFYRFYCIMPQRRFSLLLLYINRILKGWSSLPIFLLSFYISKLGLVCYELFLISIN
jgi:hypothetical protein